MTTTCRRTGTTVAQKLANEFKTALRSHPSQRQLQRNEASFLRFKGNNVYRTYSKQSTTAHAPPSLARPAANPPRLRWARYFAGVGVAAGAVYLADKFIFSSSLTRTARTFATGVLIASDYKINFRAHPPFAESLAAVHARNADRIFNLLRANGGLYLKIGQAIAMQSAVLPPEFQARFSRMFDDAPQNSWADVESVIREEFGGKSPEELFQSIEKEARASASVAQVHWARLRNGREVAVKVQKKEIQQQVSWDLWAFKVVMYVYTKLFDLPLYNMVPFISERLFLETDFENEAQNAERMRSLVSSEARLRGKVHIPLVYHEFTTRRVMTAEWIEGVRLWDKHTLTSPWKGGKGHGTPGCRGEPLNIPENQDKSSCDGKPVRESWRGAEKTGGLGVQLKDVMHTMVELFSAQMFMWGFVHCDPHPGNILIRRIPSDSSDGKAELVLLDHGLYTNLNRDLRLQYAELWRALIALDMETVRRVAGYWGIMDEDAELFGSAVLLRPYGSTRTKISSLLGSVSPSDSFVSNEASPAMDEAERVYLVQQASRQAIRRIFGGVEGEDGEKGKWPLELIFVGRALRIIQANNQYLGSPVNRLKLTGLWASRAMTRSEAGLETNAQLVMDGVVDEQRLPEPLSIHNACSRCNRAFRALLREATFRFVLFSSDLFFWITRIRQWAGVGGGMEDELELQMRNVASGLGVQLNSSVFEG